MPAKEHQDFASELRRMDAVEVRENTNSANQPGAVKRAMAVTELERRRQARAPDITKSSKLLRSVPLLVLGVLIAAAAYWKFY